MRSGVMGFLPPDRLQLLRLWFSLPDVECPTLLSGVVLSKPNTPGVDQLLHLWRDEQPTTLIPVLVNGPYRQQAIDLCEARSLLERQRRAGSNDSSLLFVD